MNAADQVARDSHRKRQGLTACPQFGLLPEPLVRRRLRVGKRHRRKVLRDAPIVGQDDEAVAIARLQRP